HPRQRLTLCTRPPFHPVRGVRASADGHSAELPVLADLSLRLRVILEGAGRRDNLQLPAFLGIAFLGGLVGLLVVWVGGLGLKPWRESSEFKLWLFLIVIQTALWAVGAAVLALQLDEIIGSNWPAARGTLIVNLVAVAVPLIGFATFVSGRSSLKYPL